MPTGSKGQQRPADVIGNAVHVKKIEGPTMRMKMRRFKRLTNALFEKV